MKSGRSIVIIVSFLAVCLTSSSIYAVTHQNAFLQNKDYINFITML